MIRKKEYLTPAAELLCTAPHQMLMGSLERPGGTIDPFPFEDEEPDFVVTEEETDWQL